MSSLYFVGVLVLLFCWRFAALLVLYVQKSLLKYLIPIASDDIYFYDRCLLLDLPLFKNRAGHLRFGGGGKHRVFGYNNTEGKTTNKLKINDRGLHSQKNAMTENVDWERLTQTLDAARSDGTTYENFANMIRRSNRQGATKKTRKEGAPVMDSSDGEARRYTRIPT
jgi:hypothetical protein